MVVGHMDLGQRVVHVDGSVGHVEAVDGEFIDVRWLTPLNVPSCVVSVCRLSDLTPCDDKVLPRPRSAEWWAESEAFCGAIRAALEEHDNGNL